MLAQRLRRWPNIKTALFQRVVFAGLGHQPWPNDVLYITGHQYLDQHTSCTFYIYSAGF